MVDGILFDLDGTLWNAVEAIAHSWSLVLEERGMDRLITEEEMMPCMGMLLPDIAAKLFPELPREDQLELIDACCQRENEYLSHHCGKLYPQLEETLAALSRNYPLFIVSNCQAGYIEAFFASSGLEGYFTDYEHPGRTGKPKSENIRLVVERNGLKAPIYVGDTALDAQSAREAGVPFLHAAYGFGQVEGTVRVETIARLPEVLAGLS